MTALIEPIEDSMAWRDEDSDRKRMLVFIGRYLPGTKDGGPIRSIANMVAYLSPYYDFYLVTADRDTRETQSYSGVTPGRWYRVGSARVLYCSSAGPAILRRAFREVRPHLIILNSFQDIFTQVALLLRRFGVFGKTPALLAPRGEFSAGAREIRRFKKDLYRRIAKWFELYDDLLWQVSTPREKLELLQASPAHHLNGRSIHVAYNLTDAVPCKAPHLAKLSGSLHLVFIARMNEMKNPHFLLETLCQIRGDVHLDLYGSVEDKDAAYWERCKAQMIRLPGNIKAAYHGILDHSAVPQVLHEHHFLILPTRGENFCHSAAESFVNGTPIQLSDATPWTGLEEVHAGFDIPLKEPEKWTTTLQKCVDMDQTIYDLYLKGSSEYGRRFSVEEAVKQHLAMFGAAFAKGGEGRDTQRVSWPHVSQGE